MNSPLPRSGGTSAARPGKLVLSFDLELAWGAIENGYWKRREAAGVYARTRSAVRSLLECMLSLEIPATWAFVGGLLEPAGKHCFDHLPEPLRATVSQALRAGKADSFDGRDVIESIALSPTPHRFACHTYSHTRFTYAGLNANTVREDFAHYWRVVPRELRVASTLVYPRNEEGVYDEVIASGFRTFRGTIPHLLLKNRLAHLLSAVVYSPPLSLITEIRPALWSHTASLFFSPGFRRLHRLSVLYMQAIRGLNAAVRSGGTLHVCNHPFNFGECPFLLQIFLSFLRKAATYRDKGLLAIEAF
jgi:hypothetical protein